MLTSRNYFGINKIYNNKQSKIVNILKTIFFDFFYIVLPKKGVILPFVDKIGNLYTYYMLKTSHLFNRVNKPIILSGV